MLSVQVVGPRWLPTAARRALYAAAAVRATLAAGRRPPPPPSRVSVRGPRRAVVARAPRVGTTLACGHVVRNDWPAHRHRCCPFCPTRLQSVSDWHWRLRRTIARRSA